jgi:sugar lactone lactonase YvrE
MTLTSMTAKLAAMATVGVLAACGTTASGPPISAGTSAASEPSASAPSPVPFQVISRYRAASVGLTNPRELAIGPDGNLYLTEGAQRVSVLSPQGKLLRQWGKPGSGPGEFRFVTSDAKFPSFLTAKIAVGPDGSVYVSDSGNGRVQVFTSQGMFVRQFVSFGNGPGQMLRPFDLVVDQAGNVYVIDDGRTSGQLAKFSPAGQLVWRLPEGEDPDLTGHLHMRSIDAHGRLVLGNDDLGRVVYLSQDGHKVDAFGDFGPDDACEVSVDAQGRTYVTGCMPGQPTRVFDRLHRLVGTWPGPGSPDGLGSPMFARDGTGVALTWDGTILVLRVTLPAGS